MLQTLLDHINVMARDIAVTETLGPNPHAMMQHWMDTVLHRMVERNPGDTEQICARLDKLEVLFDEVAGKQRRTASPKIAEAFDTYRALNVASRLGSASVTDISDVGTQALTATYTPIPGSAGTFRTRWKTSSRF